VIHLVYGDDDLAADRRALALHDPAAGVAAIACPVLATGGLTRLAGDLLISLGKSPSAGPVWTTEADETRTCAIWLRAMRIGHVVLVQAQWLTDAATDRLVAMADEARTDLWLVTHPGLRLETEAALRNAGATAVDPADFWHAAPTFARPIALPVTAKAQFPSARDLLALPVVRAGSAYATAEAWALTHHPLDAQHVGRFLELALAACASEAEARATTQGLAAGLARRGLSLEPSERSSTMHGVGEVRRWRGIAAFRDPSLTAAATLSTLFVGIDEMLELAVGDIGDGAVRIGDERIGIPPIAQPLIDAQAIAREGAGPGARLLMDGLMRPSPARLRKAILAIRETSEPDLRLDDIVARGARPARWLAQQGLRIRRVEARIRRPLIGESIAAYVALLEEHLSSRGDAVTDPVLAPSAQPRRAVADSDHPFRHSYRPRRADRRS
jgi:hypothetical protein